MRKCFNLIFLALACFPAWAQSGKDVIADSVLKIAQGTTEIKDMAYYGKTDFNKVVIPRSVTKIGQLAFHNCTNLKEVDIPNTVKTIGNAAFQNCTSLKKVKLHEGLTNLSFRLFKNTAISEITIPTSVSEAGNEVFMDCPNLSSIRFIPGSKLSDDQQKKLINSQSTQSTSSGSSSITTTSSSASRTSNGSSTATISTTSASTTKTTGSGPKQNDGFIHVEGGTFILGNNQGNEYERPAHRVTVSSFYMCDHEVTQSEYSSVTGRTNRSNNKGGNHPVEKIYWYDAIVYCNKLSVKQGLKPCYSYKGETDVTKWGEEFEYYYSNGYDHNAVKCDFTANGYRLPTEAEWEYAYRGGNKSKGYKYSGSNNLDEVAWYAGNSDEKTHDVKQKKPNELGLYDMTGNVSEYCWDWLAMFDGQDEVNPVGYTDGFYYFGQYRHRVYKGMAYSSSEIPSRMASKKIDAKPYSLLNFLGFRVVRNDPNVSRPASTPNTTHKKILATKQFVGDDFILVEGGTFRMGYASGETNERPVHNVTLSSFYICDHEVTEGEYKEIMRVNPNVQSEGDSIPVYWVNWYNAVLYCNVLSLAKGLTPCYSLNGSTNPWQWEQLVVEAAGHETAWDKIVCDFKADGYRLPTEAEWEYAARGAGKSKGYRFSGSNNIFDVAWFGGIWTEEPASWGMQINHELHKIKQKKPNELGLYDMSGNTLEWCWDLYGNYSSQSVTNPTGAKSSASRVMRGGSYVTGDVHYENRTSTTKGDYVLSNTHRYCYYPDNDGNGFADRNPGMGIRLVRTAK